MIFVMITVKEKKNIDKQEEKPVFTQKSTQKLILKLL